MIKPILAAACLLASLIPLARAQTPEEKNLLAAGPALVRILPGAAQWSVDITYTTTAAPFEGIRPKRIAVTKKEGLRHEERLYDNGVTGDIWQQGRMEVERRSNSPKLMTKCISDEEGSDFPELEWVSEKTFVGIRMTNDRKCLVFQQERFNDLHTPLGTATAVVDAETRHPLAYNFQSQTRRYTILPAPTAPLTMPPDIAAAGRAMLEHINRATPHLAAP